MNWLIDLFGSGLVFFLGVGLVLAGVAACVGSLSDRPAWAPAFGP